MRASLLPLLTGSITTCIGLILLVMYSNTGLPEWFVDLTTFFGHYTVSSCMCLRTWKILWTWLLVTVLWWQLYCECCILNVLEIGNVLYISIKITISWWFALLCVYLKFRTNMTSFYCIIAISSGSSFYADTVYIYRILNSLKLIHNILLKAAR